MKFKLTVEGDLDEVLIVKAQMGKKTTEGVITQEGCVTTCSAKLQQILPDRVLAEDPADYPDDPDLLEAMDDLTHGIMEFFRKIHGNV